MHCRHCRGGGRTAAACRVRDRTAAACQVRGATVPQGGCRTGAENDTAPAGASAASAFIATKDSVLEVVAVTRVTAGGLVFLLGLLGDQRLGGEHQARHRRRG